MEPLLLEAARSAQASTAQVGGDRALPLLEPRGRAHGRPLARAAAPAAAPPRLRPGLHALRLALPRRRRSRPRRRRENSLMQDEEGLDSVEVDDLHEFLPGAEAAGIAYALYEPDSGLRRSGRDDARVHRRPRSGRARGRSRNAGRRRSSSPSGRVRGVRVGDEVDRVRARRARGRPVVAGARLGHRPRAADRGDARAGRRLRRRRRSRPSRCARLVAGRPVYMRPAPEYGDGLHARRPRLPEGLRARPARTPSTTAVDARRSRRTCADRVGVPAAASSPACARSAAGSASTT